MEYLLEKHVGLIHACVRYLEIGGVPYMEAVEEGRIGLWRAILRAPVSRARSEVLAEISRAQGRAAGVAQLVEDAASVGFDGLGGDGEESGDLEVGVALADQGRDLALARGEGLKA